MSQTPAANPPAEEQGGLPLDLRTLVLSLWRRKWIVLIGVALSVGAGVFLSAPLAKRTYKAHAIMMYTAPPERGTYVTPGLSTQVNLVKLPTNLAEVRRRLNLDVRLDALGKVITITPQKKTSLVSLTVTADTSKGAADLANTVCNVFLEAGVKLRREEAQRFIKNYESRLREVEDQLEAADRVLGEFTRENNVVNISQESLWLFQERSGTLGLLNQARVEFRIAQLQFKELDKVMKKIEGRMQKEKLKSANTESIAHVNVRAERLRELINDARIKRVREAEHEKMVQEIERLRREFKDGQITKAELDDAEMRYKVAKAQWFDTDQIRKWQKELDELDKVLVPSDESPVASAPLLMEYFQRSLELQLQLASLADKVLIYEKALTDVDRKIARLPTLQKRYLELKREVHSREQERSTLESGLSEARNLAQLETTDFAVISPAEPPKLPAKSTRKLVMIVIAGLGSIGVFATVVLRTVLDTSLKSVGEAKIKYKLPVVGELRSVGRREEVLPEDGQIPLLEEFRYVTRRLRKELPRKGARILVASTLPQEGRSSVATQLALVLGRQDERVLVIDAQVRYPHPHPLLEFLVNEESDNEAADGISLAGYLSFQREEVDEVIEPTRLPGVALLPSNGDTVPPDLLVSNRMREMAETCSETYSAILIDAPPLAHYSDAIVLAELCDAVLFVVRAGCKRHKAVQTAISRLKETGTHVLGMVVNDVHPLYLEKI